MSKLDFNYLSTRRKLEEAMPGIEAGIRHNEEYMCLEVVLRPQAQQILRAPYDRLEEVLLSDKRFLRKIRRDLLGIPWWAFWR
jgi:hypothetical protein